MISKGIIELLSQKLEIKNNSLIEKDLYLQGLLIELSKSDYFAENFAFKGGTCLTKVYFGHYRFSEDLDFTWINQKIFENKSEKQIRKMLSKEINKITKLIEIIAEKLELEFKGIKSDKHFVELGGSNKFTTLKLWYKSTTENRKTFIKIQINFIEKLFYKLKKQEIKAIAEKHKKELEFLYPKHAKMATQNTKLKVYDLKEIAAEKVRALLTRRGFKARDIIDLYFLSKKGITIKSVKKIAIKKTMFMLKYLKYWENLKNKKFEEEFKAGEEKQLIIKEISKDFSKFAETNLKELNKLAEEIRKKHKK